MMFFDGQKVSYIGEEFEGSPKVGDLGQVVATGNTASHVKWKTGSLKDQFQEVGHMSLAAMGAQHETDMFAGGLLSFSALQVHAARGSNGVIDALAEAGHLSSFEAIAEEAQALVATRIRNDPSVREAIAEIGEEAGADLVAIAAVRLLADAFGRAAG